MAKTIMGMRCVVAVIRGGNGDGGEAAAADAGFVFTD